MSAEQNGDSSRARGVSSKPLNASEISGAGGLSRHGEGCSCQRCVPFEKGNVAAVRHGALVSEARLLRDPRVREIAEEVRAVMPLYSRSDEPVIQLYAATVARVERANEAIEQVDAAASSPLSQYVTEGAPLLTGLRKDLRAWIRLAASLASDLGLSPASRSRIGLDVLAAKRLGAELLERYGGEGA
jgi:hypothetical protein